MHNAHAESCDSKSGPNPTPSYYSVQFHVYRSLIAPSIIDNLIAVEISKYTRHLCNHKRKGAACTDKYHPTVRYG